MQKETPRKVEDFARFQRIKFPYSMCTT